MLHRSFNHTKACLHQIRLEPIFRLGQKSSASSTMGRGNTSASSTRPRWLASTRAPPTSTRLPPTWPPRSWLHRKAPRSGGFSQTGVTKREEEERGCRDGSCEKAADLSPTPPQVNPLSSSHQTMKIWKKTQEIWKLMPRAYTGPSLRKDSWMGPMGPGSL
eukprot:6185235-Pyramimonas_sp.AAC.1